MEVKKLAGSMSSIQLDTPFDAAFLARLEKLHLLSRRIFSGRLHAQHRSRKLGSGLEFADHRPYAPGDDLRLLDWNLFGRVEKLYTKLYRKEEDRNLFFLLDVSASMGVEQEKIVYAKKLAAALAYIGLYEMDRVFLHGFSEGVTVSHPVLRGRKAVVEALMFFSRLQAKGKTDFAKTSRDFCSNHGGKEGMVLILSDFMDLDGCIPGLDVLLQKGFEVLAIHIVTPAEQNPDLLGEWRFIDPEGGRPHTVHLTRRMRTRYREAFLDHSRRLQRHLRARNGAYIRANSATPMEDMILKELRAGHLLA
jgi:uncharacterized protein (DUF58 family)